MSAITIEDQPPFPEWVDNTMLKAFRSCDRKAYWESFRNLTLRGGNIHLHAGGAFARGLERARTAFYAEGMPEADAVGAGVVELVKAYDTFENPEGSAKSCDRMMGALEYYFDVHPMSTDPLQPLLIEGKHAIEFSFAVPLPGTAHPITGDPILVSGRTDMLGIMDGTIYVEDDKTTKALGAMWVDQWALQSQFMTYTWAARSFGYDVGGAFIRGIAIRKTGYDHAEVPIYFPQWKLDRWLHQTQATVRRMIECWRTGEWHYDFGSGCGSYGGCSFRHLCDSPEPEKWVATMYEARDWDPLAPKELEAPKQ